MLFHFFLKLRNNNNNNNNNIQNNVVLVNGLAIINRTLTKDVIENE